LCIWYGLYATPKHHNHNLACGLIFGDLLILWKLKRGGMMHSIVTTSSGYSVAHDDLWKKVCM